MVNSKGEVVVSIARKGSEPSFHSKELKAKVMGLKDSDFCFISLKKVSSSPPESWLELLRSLSSQCRKALQAGIDPNLPKTLSKQHISPPSFSYCS